MSISYTTCSMVIGMFKQGLSEAERETFRCLYDHDHACFSEGPGQIFEGKNAILFCFPLPPGASKVDPTVTGDAPVVFFTRVQIAQCLEKISEKINRTTILL